MRVIALAGLGMVLLASVAAAAPERDLPITAPADSLDGACCDSLTFDCYIMSEEDCMAIGGIWFGPGTACEPNP